ncbi:metallophosphoesterase family protein [Bacillus sp. N9]
MMTNEADLYVYAHIHKPFIRYIQGKCLMNIGSVGLPFDGMTKSSYAIVDVKNSGFQTSIVRVDYDITKAIKQYKNSTYPNAELMCRVLENGRF